MTHFKVILVYKLPAFKAGHIGEAEIGVEAPTALEALQAAVDALKAKYPEVVITGSRTNIARNRDG